MTTPMNAAMTEEMQTCLEACTNTQKMCLDMISYCMKQDEKHRDMHLICMMRDCAEMCLLCINMIMDGSEFMGRTSALCAEMCERCAIACEHFSGDAKMMECATMFHTCATSCKTMGRMAMAYFRRSNLVTEETLMNALVSA